MKYVNNDVLSALDNTSRTSAKIDASQLCVASFQSVFGDTDAAGTVKIQMSNDVCPVGYLPDTFTPTTWSDIPSATSAITAGVGAPIKIDVAYRWLRVVFTSTNPGASTITVNMFAICL